MPPSFFKLALDRNSVRSFDKNGFMHVASSHITKAMVCPYRGDEIPDYKNLGLDADKIYHLLRDPQELEKSVPTWKNLPLHIEHTVDLADDPQHDTRIGTVGSNVKWNPPFIDADLAIWDKAAIDAIEDDELRELSCAYFYDPELKSGEYEGQHYDIIMRNIRGNHVALVDKGRAGPQVIVADAALKPKSAGETMAKRKINRNKLFAAFDANPFIERAEVTAADLLRVINCVEAQAEGLNPADLNLPCRPDSSLDEIIRACMPGADEAVQTAVKTLVNAFSEAPKNEENTTMDEKDLKSAMDACGLDAEDPATSKAFAEGVKYGERVEKDEPKKLDSEHESEGMKEAMDACGLDADDPVASKAFAEGVKYGEKVEKDEPKKLDSEHESEGAKEAMDDEPDFSGKSPEEIFAMGVDYGKKHAAAADANDDKVDPEAVEVVEAAMDRALARKGVSGKQLERRIMAKVRGLYAAAADVAPEVGQLDPMAFDSADGIYGYALKQLGISLRGTPASAYKSVFSALKQQKENSIIAMDKALQSRASTFDGKFKGLNTIKIS